MKPYSLVFLVLLSAIFGGCAEKYYGFPNRYYGAERPDVDELLHFQADFAGKSPNARAEECRWLLKRQQETPQLGWTMRLMMGRTLSDSCGEPTKLIRTYEALADKIVPDQRITWMATYHAEVLKRSGTPTRKASGTSDRKQKTDTPQNPGKDDSKLLREKLEAIRSIEKKMDENSSDETQR